ncbi:MAG TPA: GNAT family N-acetyltransferase, partial [Anaerolineae bacterium]|nr:GNAT family N-acetyltransferase [Anaerolineae bacterium]
TIRMADTDDLSVLCKLYVEFHEFHVRGVPDRLLSLGPAATYDCAKLYPNLEKIIQNSEAALFLAEIADHPVGLAEVYVRQDEANSAKVVRRYGHLQSLMVQEAYRQQGIGTRLLEAAEQWARQQGAIEMQLDIWEYAGGPLRFYEHLGYRTLRRTLVRDIDQ